MFPNSDRPLKVGDRVHIAETRDTFAHDATIVAIRPSAKRCIGVQLDGDESSIPWWYEQQECKRYEP